MELACLAGQGGGGGVVGGGSTGRAEGWRCAGCASRAAPAAAAGQPERTRPRAAASGWCSQGAGAAVSTQARTSLEVAERGHARVLIHVSVDGGHPVGRRHQIRGGAESPALHLVLAFKLAPVGTSQLQARPRAHPHRAPAPCSAAASSSTRAFWLANTSTSPSSMKPCRRPSSQRCLAAGSGSTSTTCAGVRGSGRVGVREGELRVSHRRHVKRARIKRRHLLIQIFPLPRLSFPQPWNGS